MTWYFFCVISILFTVIYSLISKRLLTNKDDTDPVAYASLLFGSVAIMAFGVYVFTGFKLSDFAVFSNTDFLVLLVANVVLYSIAPSFYYRGLKNIPLSEFTILYTLVGIYALVIGSMLGVEKFFPIRLAGGGLILFSVLMVELRHGKFAWNKYVGMTLLCTLFYALAAITDNLITTRAFLPLPLFLTLNFGIPAFLVLLINPRSMDKISVIVRNKALLRIIPLNGLFFFISFLSILSAYKYGGTPSQVNLLLSTETVVVVLLSTIFLKEKEGFLVKVVAGLLASVGVYLLR